MLAISASGPRAMGVARPQMRPITRLAPPLAPQPGRELPGLGRARPDVARIPAPCVRALAPKARARVVAAAAGGAVVPGGDAAETPAERKLRRMRVFVLVLLVLQNAASALLTRYTRVKRVGVPMYYDSTAVLLTELMKLPMCAAMMLYTLGPRGALSDLREGFSKPLDVLQLAVPALCYTVQNILFYVALTSLSAATYQVLSQTKTLATAGFWVTMLGGRLVPRQWASLTLLVAGVSAVQLDGAMGGAAAAAGSLGSYYLGIFAVVASSALSGFANVYFEKLVKTTPTSIWVRNLQLAFFALPQALLFMVKDSSAIGLTGALHGFDGAVWTAVALKALGGLVVASTVKFADSLLKSFATAVSIIVTCLISVRDRGGAHARRRGAARATARDRGWLSRARLRGRRACADPVVRHLPIISVCVGRRARHRVSVHVQCEEAAAAIVTSPFQFHEALADPQINKTSPASRGLAAHGRWRPVLMRQPLRAPAPSPR